MESYYRLAAGNALRGYSGMPYALVRLGTNRMVELDADAFLRLCRCDGVTPSGRIAADSAGLERWVREGILERSTDPIPLRPEQQYRYFPHPRKYLAQWGITGRCNLNCIHCFMRSESVRQSIREYSPDEARLVISRLRDYGFESVMLTGGEPLLHPQFAEIAAMIREAGMEVSWINTNGLLLTDSLLDDLIARGVEPKLAISFDGFGTHDWMRGRPGTEERALRAIRLCGERGIPLRVCINLNRRTLPGAVECAKRLRELGATQLFFLRTTETPRWTENSAGFTEPLTLDMEEYMEAILQLTDALIGEVRKGLTLKFFGVQNVTPQLTGADLARVHDDPPEARSAWCPKCAQGIFITSEGYVIPCDGFEGAMRDEALLPPELNLLQHDLPEILEHPAYQRFLGLTAADILTHNAECRVCPWWESCGGGTCRVNALVSGFRRNGCWNPADAADLDPAACLFIRGGYRQRMADILDRNP